MDVVVSHAHSHMKKLFLLVSDGCSRSVCESPLPELSHDLIGEAQVKVYTKLLWVCCDPLWAGCSWTPAKRNLTQRPDEKVHTDTRWWRGVTAGPVLNMCFTSPQGPWNTSIDSDGERLHERVRYYYTLYILAACSVVLV